MLRVQKNLVAHLLCQGFKNNGLFAPIEIRFMAHVNKARTPNTWVNTCDPMAMYLIGQALRKDNYMHKWTAASTLHVAMHPQHVLVDDAKGVQFEGKNYTDPYFKGFIGDPAVYATTSDLVESAIYDWATVMYKLIKHDPVRDFIRVHYRQKFGEELYTSKFP